MRLKIGLISFLLVFYFLNISVSAQMRYNPTRMGTQSGMSVLKRSSFSIATVDPSDRKNPKGKQYPGSRGANQLVVYTPKYGIRTETNEYGKEAIVVDGTVIKLTGANSYIPKNGFVLSGHGVAKNWISANLIVGSKILLSPDKKTAYATITPQSYTFQAVQKINLVKKLINEYNLSKGYYNNIKSKQYLGKASSELSKANEYIKKRKYAKAQKLACSASKYADYALYNAIPARANDLKGIWVRPKQKNRAQIVKAIKKIHAAGINNIFIETYYHGYTIYPSSVLKAKGLNYQRREFQGWDPLACWIQEAHKRGIKIHAWFHTFYVGNENPQTSYRHVLNAHPEWANVQKRNFKSKNIMPSKAEHNGYFLDPANPMVQNHLFEILQELVSKYPIDGLNIDYIRYPASLAPNFSGYLDSSWGYTSYARSEFKQQYGIDPVLLKPDTLNWYTWEKYRQDKVTQFVSKLRQLKRNRNILISIVIFPDCVEGSKIKLQNWDQWGQQKLVDAVMPLIMGNDEKIASEYVRDVKEKQTQKFVFIRGYFNRLPSEALQI